LVDMRLEDKIDEDEYETKYSELGEKLEKLAVELEELQDEVEHEETIKKRLTEFKRTLEKNEVLKGFDRYVFESIVEKAIIGGYDEDGKIEPHKITFVYKTGFTNDVEGAKFKPRRKNAKPENELPPSTETEAKEVCSSPNITTHGDDSFTTKIRS